MQSIKMTGKTGPDGVLHLRVPVGTPDADFEVVVKLYPHITDSEWKKIVGQTAGSITDETFFPEIPNEEQTGV